MSGAGHQPLSVVALRPPSREAVDAATRLTTARLGSILVHGSMEGLPAGEEDAQKSIGGSWAARILSSLPGMPSSPTYVSADRLAWHSCRPLLASIQREVVQIWPLDPATASSQEHGSLASRFPISPPPSPSILSHALQRAPSAVAWRPGAARQLAVGCLGGVAVWRLDRNSVPLELSWLPAARRDAIPTSLSWHPQGALLAGADARRTGAAAGLTVWEVATGRCTRLSTGFRPASRVRWSPEGAYLAAQLSGDAVRVWETEGWTHQTWRVVEGDGRSLRNLAGKGKSKTGRGDPASSPDPGAVTAMEWRPGSAGACASLLLTQASQAGIDDNAAPPSASALHWTEPPPGLRAQALAVQLAGVDGDVLSAAWAPDGSALAAVVRAFQPKSALSLVLCRAQSPVLMGLERTQVWELASSDEIAALETHIATYRALESGVCLVAALVGDEATVHVSRC